VLAAIAASDAICCVLLGERSRSRDHREAVLLLRSVRFGDRDDRSRARRARSLAESLATAIDMKDAAQYGVTFLEPPQIRRVVRAASRLVAGDDEALRASRGS
jgi:hypothetical protein